jgi:hypothetical protein
MSASMFDWDGAAAAKLNEDFKAAFEDGLNNFKNAAIGFAVGAVTGGNDAARLWVSDLDSDPADLNRNLVAYETGIKAGPLVLKWVLSWLFAGR